MIVGGLLLTACPQGDVGAPCNHGSADPPNGMVVTFPALSCNDLLCVYGEDHTATNEACASKSDCNQSGSDIFQCVEGECILSLDYVLDRSMCSKSCDSDGDCENKGPTEQPVAETTACDGDFKCRIMMELGEFCCRKMCVCADYLKDADLNEIEEACGPTGSAAESCDNVGNSAP
jgi:hypothetical protein